MELLGITAFRLLTVLLALIVIWFAGGRIKLNDLSPIELSLFSVNGVIAGLAIISVEKEFGLYLAVILLVGMVQIVTGKLMHRSLHRDVRWEPVVVVRNGHICQENLKCYKISVKILLRQLRQIGVFDIRQVELALWESNESISIIKSIGRQVYTPEQNEIKQTNEGYLLPVVIEGELQTLTLGNLGFTKGQIAEFAQQHNNELRQIFVAFMDYDRKLYVEYVGKTNNISSQWRQNNNRKG